MTSKLKTAVFTAVPDSARSRFSEEEDNSQAGKAEIEAKLREEAAALAAEEEAWEKQKAVQQGMLLRIHTIGGTGDETERSSLPSTGRSAMSEWSREPTVVEVVREVEWKIKAKQLRSVYDIPKRTELIFQDLTKGIAGMSPERSVALEPFDPFGKRNKAPDFKKKKRVQEFYMHKPLRHLQRDLRMAVKTRKYDMVASLLHQTVSRWPMTPEETSRSMEPALMVCCEGNDAQGIKVLLQAFKFIPDDITGEALYKCAMRGNVEAGREVLGFTTPQDRRRAFFRAMELRHPGFVCMLLQFDKDRTLLVGICSAGGGAHTILGKAIELAAERGHLELTQVALEHLFDPRVHVVPRNNDPRGKLNTHTERAQHWSWPSILRARHIANLRGHTDVAFLLSVRCHVLRPSNPSSPRVQQSHPAATSVAQQLANHAIHRQRKTWLPADALSMAGSRMLDSSMSLTAGGGSRLLGSSLSQPSGVSLPGATTSANAHLGTSSASSPGSAEGLLVGKGSITFTTPGHQHHSLQTTSQSTFGTEEGATSADAMAFMLEDRSVQESRFYDYGAPESTMKKIRNRNDPNYVLPPGEGALEAELGW